MCADRTVAIASSPAVGTSAGSVVAVGVLGVWVVGLGVVMGGVLDEVVPVPPDEPEHPARRPSAHATARH
jgi:hypothetical protein